MLTQFLILAAGLVLILLGANWLVDGSSSIAKKAGVSEFLIGLTIVGIGTSMPELVVSCTGAFQGSSDIAIGNVIGSNIFNVMLILGVTALICPVTITGTNRKLDMPLNLAVTLVLVLLGMKQSIFGIGSDSISRIEGVLMLAVFMLYLYLSFKKGKVSGEDEDDADVKLYKTPVAVVMILFGLAALVGGGQLFVNSAVELAKMFNVSENFIAITILSGGTSLPGVATCVVPAGENSARTCNLHSGSSKKEITTCTRKHSGLQHFQHTAHSWRIGHDNSPLIRQHQRHRHCGSPGFCCIPRLLRAVFQKTCTAGGSGRHYPALDGSCLYDSAHSLRYLTMRLHIAIYN